MKGLNKILHAKQTKRVDILILHKIYSKSENGKKRKRRSLYKNKGLNPAGRNNNGKCMYAQNGST